MRAVTIVGMGMVAMVIAGNGGMMFGCVGATAMCG